MSSKSSAFKAQTEKRYGSVEKMYIHFYTIATGTDTLDIFWYCNDTENVELFSDIKHYTHTLKNYGHYTTYTGDIFVVKNIQKFKEILILLGADEVDKQTLPLANNTSKEMHIWKVQKASKFNELFDICFQDYEIINSFSSEPSIAKNRIEMDELITTFDNNNTNQLIEVTFGNQKEFMKFYNFNQLPFTIVKSRLDNNTLINWFDTLIKKEEYQTAWTTIKKLIDFNNKENDNSDQLDEDEVDDVTSMTEQESAKISHDDWIKLFCNLYIEENKTSDILLSDIYQFYLTASNWTNTPTVSMTTFIKRLRSLNKFTIKRRAKGMMVIGCGCLVGQQADLFTQAKKGQIYTRQILNYKSDLEIIRILSKYKSDIENIGCKYAREAFILLDEWPINLDYQTILQFVSIPQISTQLSLYYDYIESIIKIIPIFETLPNGTKVRKFNSDVQKPLENFRELTNKCTLYFPFSKLKSSLPNKIAFTYDLKSADNSFQPSAFNEHFGMFVSSKEYHLFEPEKGTPQEYNNMIGTPINEIINPESKKDFTIWKEASRVVRNLDIRPTHFQS